METEFYDINDLFELKKELLKGDNDVIDKIITELSRLQSVIKDYELGMRLLTDKFNSTSFKTPNY